ncbi:MAG: hypothetical protein UY63_C0001G0010 [Parcubacteria group bacterium GW2011_GWA2_51_10]|nr:MAG: hypothetical protein UY63_C0001G0010 [Parcubacteria group bacterium GW2011_GWA2_51_10]
MDILHEVRKLLEENRRITDGHQYTVPSGDHYPYQWLWDSCFHAIILAQYDVESAKAEIRSLLSKQFSSGLVPHIIYWAPGILHLFRWGVEGTSSITQPPMIAYAAWEIHRRSEDTPFLASIFPALIAYYDFLLSERDPNSHHLASIISPDESGEDNSPRFDVPLGVTPAVSLKDHLAKRTELVEKNRECNFDARYCMRDFFWVKDVLFNTVLVENLRVLAKIAAHLNRGEHERTLLRNADAVAGAMREKMFEDGCARFGIRTTSLHEMSYRSQAEAFSWRGPVWIGAHWFIYRGLKRYGFTEEAAEICDKSKLLLERSGFRECFNPETGKGLGAHNFTWGALVLDMMEQ